MDLMHLIKEYLASSAHNCGGIFCKLASDSSENKLLTRETDLTSATGWKRVRAESDSIHSE